MTEEPSETAYVIFCQGYFHPVSKEIYELIEQLRHEIRMMLKTASYDATPEHVKALVGEDGSSEVFMPNYVALGDHEERDSRTAEMKLKLHRHSSDPAPEDRLDLVTPTRWPRGQG